MQINFQKKKKNEGKSPFPLLITKSLTCLQATIQLNFHVNKWYLKSGALCW